MPSTRQPKPIIVDGFDKGIASSPHTGFADMRGCNIDIATGSISVNQRMSKASLDSGTSILSGINITTDIITTQTNLGLNTITGTPITFSSTSALPAGLTSGAYNSGTAYVQGNTVEYLGNAYICVVAGTNHTPSASSEYWNINTYFLIKIDGNNFKLSTTYLNADAVTYIDITSVGAGIHTITTITPALFTYLINGIYNEIVGLDVNGRLWLISNFIPKLMTTTNTLYSAQGQGLVYWKGYYIVFRGHYIDIFNRKASNNWTGTWINQWQTMTSNTGYSQTHQAIVSRNDDVYFIDSNDGQNNTETNYIGRIRENLSQVFDPATPATYSYSVNVLDFNNIPYSLSEFGQYLVIGVNEKILFWNKRDTSYNYDLPLTNNSKVQALLPYSTNLYAFISEGYGGAIYQCNEVSALLVKKLPKYIFENGDFTLLNFSNGGIDSNEQKLYFNIGGKTGNSGTWSFDTLTTALIMENWCTDYDSSGYEMAGDTYYGGNALLWSNLQYFSSYQTSARKPILNYYDVNNKISSFTPYFTTFFIKGSTDSKPIQEINYHFDQNFKGALSVFYRHSLSDSFTQISQPTNNYFNLSDCTDTEFPETKLTVQLLASQKNIQIKTVLTKNYEPFGNTDSPHIINMLLK